MAISVRAEGKKVNSNINVTPMVDVMLVLLIIFMVITPMLQKGEELDLTVVPGGFEDQVVVDDMGYAGESGFAAAALQAQVALHVGVAEFAADVFVLADADVSA